MLGLGLQLPRHQAIFQRFQGLPDLLYNQFGLPAAGYSVRLNNKDYAGSLYRPLAYDGANGHGSAGILPKQFGSEYWIDMDSKLIDLDAAAVARGLTPNSTYGD